MNLQNKIEVLPFRVRPVRDQNDLTKAVFMRQTAYERHIPLFASTLKTPESSDMDYGVVVLLAESKLDGSCLGTMRIQTNQFQPLALEKSVTLPDGLRSERLAEATRFGVASGKAGHLVNIALFKAFYLLCKNIAIDSMVIAGRAPLDRIYQRLLFKEVFPGQGYVELRHAGNMPHRIMSLSVNHALELWETAQHPLLDFVVHTQHPDMEFEFSELPVLQFLGADRRSQPDTRRVWRESASAQVH